MNAILFWLAKPIAEFLLAFAVILVIALFFLVCSVPRMIRQVRCKHPSVRETMACQAICNHCGKDLGFIQTWRDAKRKVQNKEENPQSDE